MKNMIQLDYQKLNEFIRNKKVRKGDLARQVGVSNSALSKVLHGDRGCEVGEYARICKALGTELEHFLTNE